MREDVATWFARRTLRADELPDAAGLLPLLGSQRVSVVLPALDEAATVGAIVATLRRALVDDVPLVHELVVVDGGSRDDTVAVASRAGAAVVRLEEVPAVAGVPGGKGTALWASLQVTSGELVVWIDADIRDVTPAFVTGLVAPLLLDPAVSFVKACYDRPLRSGSAVLPTGGGRVTELLARPLIAAHWPQLAGVVQPLSGEYAGRRSLLGALPFVNGYGVELALLVRVLEAVGLDGIAQVDLGRRTHRNRGDADLGRMAAGILATASMLLGRDDAPRELTQFERGESGAFAAVTTEVSVSVLPPTAGAAAS